MRNVLPIIICCVLALVLGGCASRYLADESIPVELRGAVGVELESFGGDVTIIAGADVDRPRISLLRESTHGYGRSDEAAAALETIELRTEVRGGSGGQVLHIEAITSHVEPHFQRAHLEIQLRELTDVTVRTSRGRLHVMGASGAIDLSTGDGDVRVATNLPVRHPVRVTTGNGDIELRIRGESSGVLDFHAVGGTVVQRIRYGRTIVHPGTDDRTLHATYNGGENPITLRARDGDITFVVDDEPMDFGWSLF